MRGSGVVRRAAALTAAASLLLVAGCGPDAGSGGVGASDVDVATAPLQQLKAAAGIETCAPGPATGGTGTTDLPDLTLPCLGGGPSVNLDTLRGPLVINLWQSSCVPCRKEIPALQAFEEQYGDRVGLLGIDWVDTHPEAALDLLEASGATYPQLADPGGTLLDQDTLLFRSQGSPQFVLVDADGAVVYQGAGGLTDVDEVKALVEQHLGVTL